MGESIYGFTPLQIDQRALSDGVEIWQGLFGQDCPSYKAFLPLLVIILMLLPVFVGVGKAIKMK